MVDDDEDVRVLVAMLLREVGLQVRTAESALEALRIIREDGPPILAIVNVAMPELNGLDLVRLLRARSDTADMPVMFLSARVMPSDIEAGRALGADYVTKPFRRDALLNAVVAAIGPLPLTSTR